MKYTMDDIEMPRTRAKEKVDYGFVKIPKDLIDEIDEILGKYGYRSRSEFVKDAIRSLLREYGIFKEKEGKAESSKP